MAVYDPPALHVVGEPHDTEVVPADAPTLRAPVPGTSSAACQMPLLSLTTNAWVKPEPSGYDPPALQASAATHDSELTCASPRLLRGPVPGTSLAMRQIPLVSSTTR